MKVLHIANTFFEEELRGGQYKTLHSAICSYPMALQLQFLPMLYAIEGDPLAIVGDPFDWKPPLVPLQFVDLTVRNHTINDWGASQLIIDWAKQMGHAYSCPPIDLTRKIQSKLYAFQETLRPIGSRLIYSLDGIEGPLLLKKPFSTAGRGHFLIQDSVDQAALMHYADQWPLIAEPYLKRTIDFSTQWHIGASIDCLGAVLQISGKRGHYLGSVVDDEETLFGSHRPFIERHKEIAFDFLMRIQSLGFFGFVGLDGLIYEEKGESKLLPIVEINARKTMGFAALMCRTHHFPHKRVTLSFKQGDIPLLPSQLRLGAAKAQQFSQQLYLTIA